MVLSNKKLKQKLRAAKAEQIVQNSLESKNLDPLKKNVTEDQKPRISKREKRRQKLQQENPEAIKLSVGAEKEKQDDSKLLNNGKIKPKKRKRDQTEASENVKEKKNPEKLNKKKKSKARKKPKKKAENKKVEDGTEQNETVSNNEQTVVKPDENIDGKDPEASNKVYVGGIPYYSTEDDIRSYFEGCGTITSIDCMTFPDSGKFRGIAIIGFKTEAAAKRALTLDGSDMGGLFLKIQPFKSAKTNKSPNFNPTIMEGYNRIYAGNLAWDITEDDLKKLFSDCNILSIRFGEDKQTGEFKGYAHVDFADGLSMNVALRLDQTVVCGRPVRITCAVPKKGTSENSKSPVSKDSKVDTNKTRSPLVEDQADYSMVKPMPKDDNDVVKNYGLIKVDDDQVNTSEVLLKVDENQVNTSGVLHKVEQNQVNTTEVTVSSSKIRRRTCYECGERGHISSLCPKNLIKVDDNQVNTGEVLLKVEQNQVNTSGVVHKVEQNQVNTSGVVHEVEQNQVNTTEVTVSSSKIRRRTCYECGERGHISSLCPKKLAADSSNQGATA